MATLNDKIKAVYEAQKALREATEKVDGYNQWMFSVHTHWEQPRVSIWEAGKSDEKGVVTFILNDDGWQMPADIGCYKGEESMVEAAFRAWLAHSA